MEGFNDELESFKVRVQDRAKARIERAMKEYEEEERQKRLGPGGLDPVDVYESLPQVSNARKLVPLSELHDPFVSPCVHICIFEQRNKYKTFRTNCFIICFLPFAIMM